MVTDLPDDVDPRGDRSPHRDGRPGTAARRCATSRSSSRPTTASVHAVDDVDVRRSPTTRRSASSASRARARASRRWRSSACCPSPRRSPASVLLPGRVAPRAVREGAWRRSAGAKIAMIFQDALAALNPVYTVGNQIAEAIQVHHGRQRRRSGGRASSSCSRSSASRTRASASTSTRTSTRAACASGR